MDEFTGKIIIGNWLDVELRKNKLWVIVSPLVWVRPSGNVLSVTPYLITDYASIPSIFWPIIPKRDIKYDLAAVFHDDCMRHRKIYGMSKTECHNVFKEIMKHFGTEKWKYRSMYYAVHLGGIFASGKGDGTLPWKLSKSEKDKYEEIKQTYSWNVNF